MAKCLLIEIIIGWLMVGKGQMYLERNEYGYSILNTQYSCYKCYSGWMIALIQNMLLISDKHSVQSVQVNMLGALFYCGPYLHISAILMSSFLNIQISGSTSSASEHDRRSISLQRGFGSGPTSSLADCFLQMPVFIREFLQCNVLY